MLISYDFMKILTEVFETNASEYIQYKKKLDFSISSSFKKYVIVVSRSNIKQLLMDVLMLQKHFKEFLTVSALN